MLGTAGDLIPTAAGVASGLVPEDNSSAVGGAAWLLLEGVVGKSVVLAAVAVSRKALPEVVPLAVGEDVAAMAAAVGSGTEGAGVLG